MLVSGRIQANAAKHTEFPNATSVKFSNGTTADLQSVMESEDPVDIQGNVSSHIYLFLSSTLIHY